MLPMIRTMESFLWGALKYEMSYKCVHVIASNSWLHVIKCWLFAGLLSYYSNRDALSVRVFDFIAMEFFNFFVCFSLLISFQTKIFRWMRLDQFKTKRNEMKRKRNKKIKSDILVPCHSVYFLCLLLILIEESQYKIAFHHSYMWASKASYIIHLMRKKIEHHMKPWSKVVSHRYPTSIFN